MECNRDEAIKAREYAERNFDAKDIASAKKFALKAQKLYPGLEGISSLLATLDVYLAAQNLIMGEPDFYGVLGVDSRADEDTIRKQYRKLALMLHPDKNKSIGAEGAFKFISEAWSLLSDKDRKVAYDARRKSHVGNPTNGFYNFAKSTSTNPKASKTHRNGSSSSKSNQGTFWTVCHRCKMQYEYLRSYLNQNLQCPNHTCMKPFIAIETPPPVSGISTFKVSNKEGKSKGSHNDGNNMRSFQWTPFSGSAGVSSASQAANVVQQTYEKVKRVREEAQAARKREKAMKRKQNGETFGFPSEKKRRVSDDVSSTVPPPKSSDDASIYASRLNKFNSTRELSYNELRSILMHKARKEILNTITINASQDKTKESYGKNERQDSSRDSKKSDCSVSQCNEIIDRLSIPVPDPDFFDFDKDRTENAFGENQLWAAYDNDDGMPRFYAMVRSVISRNPFKVRIGWLNSNSNSNSEVGPPNCVGSSFSKTCGDFKVGRHETYDSLNCFSHRVRWTKGTRGAICIFPMKGDVWALYRNWSRDWNEITSVDVIRKYDMVEVLDDYDEEQGVVVIPLVKVAGFKAVFHHHSDPKQVRRIPKEEILRFSHQVPSHLISGQEGFNALKGCRELDPASLPSEFLHVIAVEKEDNDENHENIEAADKISN